MNEAFSLAQKAFDDNPDDIWNRRNLAWVVYDFAKQNFLRTKTWWKNYGEFCRWWGFDGFQDEDYLPQQNQSGEKISPLAERHVNCFKRCRRVLKKKFSRPKHLHLKAK